MRQPRPQDTPETRSFSGPGDRATSMFRLSSGLKKVSATHQGEDNFVVYILDSTGEEVDLVANEIGTANVSSTLTVPEDGLYLFVVEADGPWTIKVK